MIAYAHQLAIDFVHWVFQRFHWLASEDKEGQSKKNSQPEN
jgi:hypothetical protein